METSDKDSAPSVRTEILKKMLDDLNLRLHNLETRDTSINHLIVETRQIISYNQAAAKSIEQNLKLSMDNIKKVKENHESSKIIDRSGRSKSGARLVESNKPNVSKGKEAVSAALKSRNDSKHNLKEKTGHKVTNSTLVNTKGLNNTNSSLPGNTTKHQKLNSMVLTNTSNNNTSRLINQPINNLKASAASLPRNKSKDIQTKPGNKQTARGITPGKKVADPTIHLAQSNAQIKKDPTSKSKGKDVKKININVNGDSKKQITIVENELEPELKTKEIRAEQIPPIDSTARVRASTYDIIEIELVNQFGNTHREAEHFIIEEPNDTKLDSNRLSAAATINNDIHILDPRNTLITESIFEEPGSPKKKQFNSKHLLIKYFQTIAKFIDKNEIISNIVISNKSLMKQSLLFYFDQVDQEKNYFTEKLKEAKEVKKLNYY